jgi:hypothetical protein
MNKEKLMQLLEEGIEKTVSINLHFTQFQDGKAVRKEEAQQLINQFSEALGSDSIEHTVNHPHAESISLFAGKFRITCSYIPTDDEKAEAKRKRIEQLKTELSELEKEQESLA